jgi:hypothetical protein
MRVMCGAFGGEVMRFPRLIAACATMLAGSISASYAGPCWDEIYAVQAKIDAMLEAKAAAGPPATAEAMAGTSPQPTPRSMAAVEERMGEILPPKVNAIEQGMARAREADSTGDKAACEQALAEVRRNLDQ